MERNSSQAGKLLIGTSYEFEQDYEGVQTSPRCARGLAAGPWQGLAAGSGVRYAILSEAAVGFACRRKK